MIADRLLLPGAPGFPVRVLQVRPQPSQLYVRGDVEALQRRAVAIIGSREPSSYGCSVAYAAAQACARAGLVVISGMARGLDAQAHRGAIAAGGQTIAVLGTGLDVRYPTQNLDLLNAIPEHGALVTEYPAGTKPRQFQFPARNRLIAALAETVLVVEGKVDGGTANTVGWFAGLNKVVWAVPGRVDESQSQGPNRLIQQGAHVYCEPRDLLESLGIYSNEAAEPAADSARPLLSDAVRAELTSAEATLFDLMTPEPVHVDDIAGRAALEPGLLLAALSTLEIQGLITQLPGKRFALAS